MWEELYGSGDRLQNLRVRRNADGRLEVFGVGPDNRIWHTWQVSPNDGWVGAWNELYSPGDRLVIAKSSISERRFSLQSERVLRMEKQFSE
jgi:hypothetical protein